MDPEVQGVLSQAGERWPHIGISDSLLMADRAVKMAEQGCQAVAVLGVDFMSENVRAILDEAGHRNVQVSTAPAPDCSDLLRIVSFHDGTWYVTCPWHVATYQACPDNLNVGSLISMMHGKYW